MNKWRIGLALIFLYAAGYSFTAWTAEEADDGPGAFAVMVFGFLILGAYLLARCVSWISSRRENEARGFPIQPLEQAGEL